MADEVNQVSLDATAPAAVSSVASSPATENVTPSHVATPSAVEGSATATTSAPVEPTKEAPGLLGTDPAAAKPAEKPTEPVKPDAVAPDATQPKEEASQSAEPAPLPTYEPFKIPEGFQADTEKLGEFTKELAEFESLSKADHAATQALGQKLMDRHISELKEALDRQTKLYTDFWEKKKNDWKESFIKDPELGGNRMETTINNGRDIIRNYGGTPEQQQELRSVLVESGLEGHPALIRLLNNISKSPLVTEGKPLSAAKPVSAPQSKRGKWYGGSAT